MRVDVCVRVSKIGPGKCVGRKTAIDRILGSCKESEDGQHTWGMWLKQQKEG